MEKGCCRKCGSSKVAPSRAKRGNWICSPCNNKQINDDPARYMARKQMCNRRHKGQERVGTHLVRRIIVKWQGRSILSGESNWRRLCVVRIDTEQPWSVDNAVLVTSAESYALSAMGARRTQTVRTWADRALVNTK